MKKYLLIFALSVFTFLIKAQDYTFGSTEVNVSILNDDMDIPWDVSWGPDHMLWITDGPHIKRMNPKTGEFNIIWTSPRRLLGMPSGNGLGFTFHPDFLNNGEVFLALDTGIYYQHNSYIEVTKLTYSFKKDTLLNPEVLFSYSTSGEHCGARMITTQDGKIMITTPDYWYELPENSLQGRVLRFNTDGTPALDNPFGNYTYSYGHRNAQGLIQTPNGKIYVSEHGQWSNDQDELNFIIAGGNYGWPAFDGFECAGLANDSCTSPTFSHISPIDGGRNPPSGIDYYNHPAIPEFSNSIIEASLSPGGIIVFNLSSDGTAVTTKTNYLDVAQAGFEFKRLRDVCTGPDGKIYAITNDRENMSFGPWPDNNDVSSDAKIRVIKNKHYDHCTPTSSVQYHLICDGESVEIDGTDYFESQNVIQETTNAAGCDSLVIHVIEKFESYQFELSDVVICEGETAEVFGTTVSYAGIYLDEYTTVNGCDSVYQVEVIVNPMSTDVTVGENEISANMSNAFFQWLECPGMEEIDLETAQVFQPTQPGSYAVEITTIEGCVDTSVCENIILTSTADFSSEISVVIAPNPVQETIHLTFSGLTEGDVTIYDLTGKIIFSQHMNLSIKQSIPFSEFSNGVYFLSLQSKSKLIKVKITK